MYHALYRKWRPKVFDDVIGQQAVVQTLKNQVKFDKISHAYLFTGQKGTGKTSCAKILAKAANCPNATEGNPCNICKICCGIDDGSVMDILEIDAASNNGVDNIRDLREEANFTPTVARYRVYIIDEAHMLSMGAFNALLKILEEPPSYVMFILATTELHKVPTTIMSRCQRFDFKKIGSEDISQRLTQVAEAEGIKLQDEAALLIANLSDGAMRDALSILDSCASLNNSDITTKIVESVSYIADSELISELVDNMYKKNTQKIFERLDEINIHLDALRFCQQLINYFRNLMIIKGTDNPVYLINALPSQLEVLRTQAKNFTMEQILYILSELSTCSNNITKSSSKKLELEMCIIKIVSRETIYQNMDNKNETEDVSNTVVKSIMDRVSKLEEKINNYNVTIDQGRQLKDNKLTGDKLSGSKNDLLQSHCSQQADKESLYKNSEELTCWNEILIKLEKINPALSAALNGSKGYINAESEIILIDARSDFFLDIIRNSKQAKQTLKKAIYEHLGKKYRIGPYVKDEQSENALMPNDILKEIEQAALDAGITPEII